MIDPMKGELVYADVADMLTSTAPPLLKLPNCNIASALIRISLGIPTETTHVRGSR